MLSQMRYLSSLEEEVIRTFKGRLENAFGVRLRDVRLFGSRARGEGNEGSDIDILVLVQNLTREEKSRTLDWACDLWLDRSVPLSPLVMSEEHYRLLVERERLLAKEIQAQGLSL